MLLPASYICAAERVWKSSTGVYEMSAEMISFNDEQVVLKRSSGELVAVDLSELCEADRQYTLSKEVQEAERKAADEMQIWTSKNGMKVEGRVRAFGRKDLEVRRRQGKVQVNGSDFSSLDPIHQKVVLRIISELEKTELSDEKSLRSWAIRLGAEPKSYTLEGVMLQLATGDLIGVPFFLFSEQDQKVLQPGWDAWLADHDLAPRDSSRSSRKSEQDFLVQAAARAYQANREAEHRQIEVMKLQLLATATGVVSIWQVGLMPGPGVIGRPLSVMVPAQDSQQATFQALQKYPGYVLVGVRRANR
ncbi:MAG: hypothetical protein KF752_07665 [Pirellulaceae bacterium]|nr:hypothetical protein [Pirellulaceae bacterium]